MSTSFPSRPRQIAQRRTFAIVASQYNASIVQRPRGSRTPRTRGHRLRRSTSCGMRCPAHLKSRSSCRRSRRRGRWTRSSRSASMIEGETQHAALIGKAVTDALLANQPAPSPARDPRSPARERRGTGARSAAWRRNQSRHRSRARRRAHGANHGRTQAPLGPLNPMGKRREGREAAVQFFFQHRPERRKSPADAGTHRAHSGRCAHGHCEDTRLHRATDPRRDWTHQKHRRLHPQDPPRTTNWTASPPWIAISCASPFTRCCSPRRAARGHHQ